MSRKLTLLMSAGTFALAVGLSPIAIDTSSLHLKSNAAFAKGGETSVPVFASWPGREPATPRPAYAVNLKGRGAPSRNGAVPNASPSGVQPP